MKKLIVILAAVAVGLGVGCLERHPEKRKAGAGLLYQHHFAGTTAIAKGTNALKLKQVLDLPASRELRDYALPLLARAPQEFWCQKLPPKAADASVFARPLLDDLWAAESHLEIRGPNQRLECALAIHLTDERARLWETNLSRWVSAWQLGTPSATQIEGFAGWQLKKTDPPNLLQWVRAGEWVIAGAGTDKLTLLPARLQALRASGRPIPALANNALLEIDVDLPRLGTWFPILDRQALPPVRMTVFGRGESLRTEARLRYDAPIPWKYEPWRIPTNTIRDPIVSFTVGQGIEPLLGRVRGVREFGLKPLPNQFCSWAQAEIPWQTYVSMPVANATSAMQTIAPKLPPFLLGNLGDLPGDFVWASNKAEVRWQGLPFIVPAAAPLRTNGHGFILASLFPVTPRTNPAPPDLFAQISGRTDLAYYDWELTSERLPQVVQLSTLINILKRWQGPPATVPTRKWLDAILPHLGNTITEVTVAGPQELALVRKSQVGLTGVELVALTRWLESPEFPLRWVPPPSWRRFRETNAPAGKFTNRPAAVAPKPRAQTNQPPRPRANPPAAKSR